MEIDLSKIDASRDDSPGPECCANCALYPQQFLGISDTDSAIASHNFLFEYDIQNSCLEKVSNIAAILEVYRIPYKVIHTEPYPLRVPLCLQCSTILTDLYRLTEEFNSLRKIGSVVSQILSPNSALDNVDVNNILLGSDDPDSAFDLSSSKETVASTSPATTEFQIDETSNGSIVQEETYGSAIDEAHLSDMLTEEHLKGQVHLPVESMIVAGTIAAESTDESQQASVWLAPPVPGPTAIDNNDKLNLSNSSALVAQDTGAISSTWELPRSTTAIAVPIGDNLLQLYRVAPVLPKEPPFACMHCGKEKKSFVSLKNHIHNVHNLHKSVSCPLCLKVFRKPCLLKKHSIIHEEGYAPREQKSKQQIKPLLVCSWPDCGRSFLYKTSLERHEARHRPDRPFICDLCLKAFKLVGDLRIHIEFHKEDRPFVCDKCGRSYKVASNLQTHIINSHTEEGRLKYNEYMRNKTRRKRLNRAANQNQDQDKLQSIIQVRLTNDNFSATTADDHDEFLEFVVAAEAEIETEEISETNFT